jgi:cytochrome P450
MNHPVDTTMPLTERTPVPMRPLHALTALRRNPMALLDEMSECQGDLAWFAIGSRQVAVLAHPDLARAVLVTHTRSMAKGPALRRAQRLLGQGLLTVEGERHLRNRRMMQPAFHRDAIARYAGEMTAAAETMAAHLLAGPAHTGNPRDLAALMHKLTLIIAGRTLFGADVEADAPEVGRALNDFMALFGLLNSPLGEISLRLPLPSTLRLHRADAEIRRVVGGLVAARRTQLATGQAGDFDLLGMLLAARDDEGAGWDDQQVMDEAITLFLAGHETTANALAWCWHLLAGHPACQERLHAELQAALGSRPAHAGDLPALSYTRAVISESLRLYPPAWVIGRQTQQPVTLPSAAGPVTLPAGVSCLIPVYRLHRDPRFWPDADTFRPERWLATGAEAPAREAFLPFGAGNRICIGEHFAWTEMMMVVAAFARHFQMKAVPGQAVALQPSVTLRPKGGMPLHLIPRRRTAV